MFRFWLILIALILCFPYGLSSADPYTPYYNKFSKTQDTGLANNKVQVLAFFSYKCRPCREIEHHLKAWLEGQPDNVVYQWIASPKGFQSQALSHAYYAALDMKQEDRLGPALYDAILEQGLRLNNKESVAEFMAEQLGRDTFSMELAMDTLSVRSGQLYAQQLVDQYNVVFLPSIIINGKYITHSRLASNPKDMIHTLDYLVNKELGNK